MLLEGSGGHIGVGQMDPTEELFRRVARRVKALEPECASQLLNGILAHEKPDRQLIMLFMATDAAFKSAIARMKQQYCHPTPPPLSEYAAAKLAVCSSLLGMTDNQQQLQRPNQLYIPDDNSVLLPPLGHESLTDMQVLHTLHSPQGQYEEKKYLALRRILDSRHLPQQTNNGSESPAADGMQAFAWKPCVYYSRGYCKHGSSCRFLHGSNHDELHSTSSQQSPFSNGTQGETGGGSGSLEQLEVELCELLRGRRAPVSIASLPQLYYERYGRTLQAEGYLTESQRHGKAGFSLTKLLARLKNTVTLIDRPHGQHAVVLAEEAHRFIRQKDSEEQNSVRTSPVSRQIYLTFPSESTFTEDDVRNHFRQYGDVHDVRIPYQNKRMFGFVTFLDSSTVRTILAEGNPHYICGARVLVKPYREKGKHAESKYVERSELSSRHPLTRINDSNKYCYAHGFPFCADFGRQVDYVSDVNDAQKRQFLELRRAESQLWGGEVGEVSPASQQLFQNSGLGESEYNSGAEDLRRFSTQNRFSYRHDGLDGSLSMDSLQLHDEEIMVHALSSSLASSSTGSISSIHGSSHNLPEGPNLPETHNLPEAPFLGSYDAPEEFRTFRRVQKAASYDSLGGHSFAASSKPVSVSSDHDITCCICFEYFVDPVTLDCTHTFCQRCISQVLKAKEECPVCRRQVAVNRFNKEIGRPEAHLTTPLHYRSSVLPGSIWH